MQTFLKASALAVIFATTPVLAQQAGPTGRPTEPAGTTVRLPELPPDPAGISGKTTDGRPIDPTAITNKTSDGRPTEPAGISGKPSEVVPNAPAAAITTTTTTSDGSPLDPAAIKDGGKPPAATGGAEKK
jgi:hypothetical protein